MSATGSTLVSRVRDLIQESAANAWSDAQVREILNLMLGEVWEVVEVAAVNSGWLLQAFTAISITADDDEYDLPTGIVDIEKVEFLLSSGDYTDLVPLRGVSDYRSGLTAQDPPTFYLPLASSFKLMPPPSVTRASAIVFWGSAGPTNWTGANVATATSGLPFKCDRVLILGSVAMIMEAEGSAVSGAFRGQYEKALAQLPGKLDFRVKSAADPEDDAGIRSRYPGGEDLDS